MSAVPGLSLRTTLAQILDDAIGTVSSPGRGIPLADAILADPRLVVALHTNTREGWLTKHVSGGDHWTVNQTRPLNYGRPNGYLEANADAQRVLVVPVDPPEATDA